MKSVHVLLGNAITHVALNGFLTNFINLKRSTRQGFPLAPRLFFIVVDALGWCFRDSLGNHDIKGKPILGFNHDFCL